MSRVVKVGLATPFAASVRARTDGAERSPRPTEAKEPVDVARPQHPTPFEPPLSFELELDRFLADPRQLLAAEAIENAFGPDHAP